VDDRVGALDEGRLAGPSGSQMKMDAQWPEDRESNESLPVSVSFAVVGFGIWECKPIKEAV